MKHLYQAFCEWFLLPDDASDMKFNLMLFISIATTLLLSLANIISSIF